MTIVEKIALSIKEKKEKDPTLEVIRFFDGPFFQPGGTGKAVHWCYVQRQNKILVSSQVSDELNKLNVK